MDVGIRETVNERERAVEVRARLMGWTAGNGPRRVGADETGGEGPYKYCDQTLCLARVRTSETTCSVHEGRAD